MQYTVSAYRVYSINPSSTILSITGWYIAIEQSCMIVVYDLGGSALQVTLGCINDAEVSCLMIIDQLGLLAIS